MELIYISLKLITGFFLLFLVVRIIGGKLIDQITPFHFISAVVLSELIGNAVYKKDVPLGYVIYAVLFWGGLLLLIEYLLQKFAPLRKLFEGKPVTVIRNGQIDYQQLKKSRMNINQLQSLLRQSETFSVREVAFALIEPNGSLSILKKTPYQKTTREDFHFPPEAVHLPITLIRDGKCVEENLDELSKDHQWLHQQLLTKGVEDISHVLFAEWLQTDGLFVVKY